jgi:His-Xaa-Ser system protein HxsD
MKAANFKVETKNNRIVVPINPRLYPPEAVYGAAYVFLDRAYLFLDGDAPEKIAIYIKGKKKLTPKELQNLAGEFGNELISCALRSRISKNNQKIREYILARALGVNTGETNENKNNAGRNQPESQGPPKKWEKDALNTALPWEKKYKI